MNKSSKDFDLAKVETKKIDHISSLYEHDSHTKSNKGLDSLIAIAMTLPGITAVQAQDVNITNPQVDLFYSNYSENKNRIKVASYEGTLKFPLTPNSQIELMASRDIVSGASIVGYYPQIITGASNTVVIPGTSIAPQFLLTELMTYASIADTRNDVQLQGAYFFPESKAELSVGYSPENDFQSIYSTLGAEFYFNKKNTILFLETGIAFNTIKPSDLSFGGPNLQNSGTYNTERIFCGIKQDINKDFFIQQNAELILDNGFLSDPYKRIAFNGPDTVNWPGAQRENFNIITGYDRRPSQRTTGAFVTQFVHYISFFESSIHFDYRFALNNWNIRSNTFDLAYYQPLFKSWEIAPKVRYYSQNRAKFYALSFHTTPTPLFLHSKQLYKGGSASSDYRLANFGSIGLDLTISKRFTDPNIKLSLTLGLIKTATNYSMTKNKGPQNPSNQFNSKFIAFQLSSDLPNTKINNKETKTSHTLNYKKGDISIQPLTLALSGLTLGKKREDTKFVSPKSKFPNTMKIDMFSPKKGVGLNDTQRNGLGYDFQIGYFLLDCFEIFADLGVISERKFAKPIGVITNSFQFKARTSYRTNIGAKYYFDTETAISPFIGGMIGNEKQPKTTANVYVFNNPGIGQKLGQFKIFNAQNLFNGAFLIGADYRFDKTYALSFSTGLYYYQRNKTKSLTLPTRDTFLISDNKNKVIVPFSISLKIIL